MKRFPDIRAAELSDSDEIARLSVNLGYPVTGPKIERRLVGFRESDKHFIAVAPGAQSTLVGWVVAEHRLLLTSGERIEIVGLVVDRSARKSGIGRALVSAVENWALQKGLAAIGVRSNVTRGESHGFYEKLGYERTKTQHAYAKKLDRLRNRGIVCITSSLRMEQYQVPSLGRMSRNSEFGAKGRRFDGELAY